MKEIFRYKSLIFSILFFAFFHEYLISVYNSLVVDKLLVLATRTIWADLAFIVLVIVAILWMNEKLRDKFYIKSESLIFPSVLLVGYTFVRILNSESLLDIWIVNGIKYFDATYVVCLIPFVLKKYGVKSNKKGKHIGLYIEDVPIEEAQYDALNLNNRAYQVYSMIKRSKSKNSIAIGIVGKWGQGKSSFMNLIEERFKQDEDKDYILVHFNSWLNISIESIINDFFVSVEEKIAPYGFDISHEIKKYGKKVTSVYKTTLTESILNGLNLVTDSSLSKDFTELNSKMNALDKKVVVFFDDLDRLQPNEVFEVLKLIRNTASFDVFNFIVGYDKDYIIEALKRNGIPDSERYCEKIFVKEFPLLPVTEKEILNYLRIALLERLPKSKSGIEEFFDSIDVRIKNNHINPMSSLTNLRDAKRFVNEVLVSIEGVEDEIHIQDFILVKLLKFSYYDVYRLLFNRQKFIEGASRKSNTSQRSGKYRLRKSNKASTSRGATFESFNDTLIKDEIIALNLYNDSSLATIKEIVEIIYYIGLLNNKFSPVSLSYGQNYFKYFRDEIDPAIFLKSDFDNFLKGDVLSMSLIIDNAISNGKLEGLMEYIYQINIDKDLSSKTQYKNFVYSLFYIARLVYEDSSNLNRGIDDIFFYEMVSNYNNKIVVKFFNSKDGFDAFIQSIFYNNLYPPGNSSNFHPSFLRFVYERGSAYDFEFSLTREDIVEYFEMYMSSKINYVNAIDDDFWFCYKLCFILEWREVSTDHKQQFPRKIVKNVNTFKYELLPRFLDKFLVRAVEVYEDDEVREKYVRISKNVGIDQLFGNNEAFIEYLKSKELASILKEYPSDFLKEFIQFREYHLSHSFKTQYDFIYMPMKEKFESYLVG